MIEWSWNAPYMHIYLVEGKRRGWPIRIDSIGSGCTVGRLKNQVEERLSWKISVWAPRGKIELMAHITLI